MTTKVSPLATRMPIVLKITADPNTSRIDMSLNRPVSSLQILGMLIDCLNVQFQYVVKQQAGIVGQTNPVREDILSRDPETEQKPEPV